MTPMGSRPGLIASSSLASPRQPWSSNDALSCGGQVTACAVTQGYCPIWRSERAMSIICAFVSDFDSVLETQ